MEKSLRKKGGPTPDAPQTLLPEADFYRESPIVSK